MRIVFADTCYWVALLHPRDYLHTIAKNLSAQLGTCRIVTSEMILVESLNGLGGFGISMLQQAVEAVKSLLANPNVDVLSQTSLQFRKALERYGERLDKDWSLTDCGSFFIMEDRNLSDALADEHHFEQAGFRALLREEP
jgi:uncharacterized protein